MPAYRIMPLFGGNFRRMTPEETLDFHIRWAWAKMSKAYNVMASDFGATMPMGYALLSIDKSGTLSTRLGPKMGMEPTSMARLLKSLEQQGYIKRVPEGTDRRKVLIHLTPKGKEYRDITRQAVIRLNERIKKKIDQKKLDVFFEVIQEINTELDKNDIFIKKT